MNEGLEKARAVADKLKADTAKEKQVDEQNKQVALNQLAALAQNSELAKMYADNAKIGANNLGGELPLLKVHSVGKSSKNELSDGSEPRDGFFFYKPTGQEFDSLECHILTISEGFRAPGIEEGKQVFNQILSGVIIKDGFKPFVMYFTGKKLSYLWDFGKEASKYTRAKPVPIPMFALTVKLTTEKVTNDYGKSWIVRFEIQKFQDGSPKLVMDTGEFRFLRDSVSEIENTISSLIAAKGIRQSEGVQTTPVQAIEAEQEESVSPEDIPF